MLVSLRNAIEHEIYMNQGCFAIPFYVFDSNYKSPFSQCKNYKLPAVHFISVKASLSLIFDFE